MSTAIEKSNGAAAPPSAGTIARQDFAGQELAVAAETASTAAAAQAKAAVESRYVMALRRPRDADEVRTRLLKECARPGFADAAIYHKPIGKGVEGPSIRFAEAAIRCMTNIYPETATIYDDPQKRIMRVSVTDLEANVTYSKDIVVDKVVERKKLKEGQEPLGVRTNSYGERTYLVPASEDDLLNKEGALVSKALRSLALRLLPGDILDECMAKCNATLQDRAAKDPDAERKKVVDAFVAVGVQPSDLKAYLGHDLGACSPAELAGLRKVYATLKDGETNWADVMEHKGKTAAGEVTTPPPAQASPAAAAPSAPATQAPSTLAKAAEVVQQVTAGAPLSADALLDAILAAKDQKALRALIEQIDAQPEPRKTELRGIYSTQAKELALKGGKGNG